MDRIEEDNGVCGLDEPRQPFSAALHELGELGGNRRPRLGERRGGRIDPDDVGRRLLIAYVLEDELRDGARAAPEVDDHLTARTNHPLENPVVDMGEERMPRERRERKAILVRGWVQGGHSLWIPSGPRWTSRFAASPVYTSLAFTMNFAFPPCT